MTDTPPPTSLATLRAEIDRIDETMHRLLMERGDIIDTLIAVKGTARSGAAFRPDREASMMRALASRHQGHLPLDTAEGIWRVIIATFTYVQAPFAVHADASGGDAAMRDSARFHFGFTVPYRPRPDAASVVEAVAASRGDLGLVRLDQGATAGPWWRLLEGGSRPKIIARLPFIERPDHPAGIPVLVVSQPLETPAPAETLLFSVRCERWSDEAKAGIERSGGAIVATAGEPQGLTLLLSWPASAGEAEASLRLKPAGLRSLVNVGGHADRFAHPG